MLGLWGSGWMFGVRTRDSQQNIASSCSPLYPSVVSDYLQLNHNRCSLYLWSWIAVFQRRWPNLLLVGNQISRFTKRATLIWAFWGQTLTRVLCLENQRNCGELLSYLCCVGLAQSSSSLEPRRFSSNLPCLKSTVNCSASVMSQPFVKVNYVSFSSH